MQSLPDSGAQMAVTLPGIKSWRRNRYQTYACSIDELRSWRREHESALRSARRSQQLISKRLLYDNTLSNKGQVGKHVEAAPFTEEEVLQLLRNIQKGTVERAISLRRLRKGLQHEENQQKFIRLEGSMRVLIGLFTSNLADLQMDAAHCLHELSHSSDPDVAEACLPATVYLLTYLSGNSIPLVELCLYTLGNLVVEMKAVKEQLLPQGIIPVLASCIRSPHVVVQEGVGYVLSQLLQSKEASTEIIPLILDSTIPQDMLRLLCSSSEEGIGAAVEFAWGLHYLISSQVNNLLLISQNIIPSLVHLLLRLVSMLSTTFPEGLEVLICPVIRCIANLLAEDQVDSGHLLGEEEHLLRALSVFIQYFRHKQLFVVQECLWLINNLTADSTISCSALLSLDLFPSLLQLLCSQQVVSLLVLTVLCNVAAKGATYCQALYQKAVLPSIIGTLALPDSQVVGQVLELLHLLFLHWPEGITDFLNQSGLQALQQHEQDLQLQDQVKALIQTISRPAALPQDCSLGASDEELHFTCLKI